MNALAAGAATIGICLHGGGGNGMNSIKATRENTYNNHTVRIPIHLEHSAEPEELQNEKN